MLGTSLRHLHGNSLCLRGTSILHKETTFVKIELPPPEKKRICSESEPISKRDLECSKAKHES